jgi:UDP-N-acetyl-D-glucosamine dehydrogenase
MSCYTDLKSKIQSRNLSVVVVGLGYVGLPLAVEFAHAGYQVTGLDLSEDRVKKINEGISYIGDVPSEELKEQVQLKKLAATTQASILNNTDVVVVCVPTPLNRTKEPDMSYIAAVTDELAKHMRPGMLIVLESTTYPGTTDEVIRPKLEEGKLKAGKDFFLCFSPERIDPSNPKYKAKDIPKVVGGTTEKCTELGKAFYSHAIQEVHGVSSTRVAEMTKLIENTFRIVNIGLVNELAVISEKLGIDIWEAIDAASTKPFGYMPFYPGPGIGGHCIGIDPIYLSWKARMHGGETHFIDLASDINQGMPEYVVKRVAGILNQHKIPLSESKILIIGVAYKKDVADTRESPALDVIELLNQEGAKVNYHDPYVSELVYDDVKLKSQDLSDIHIKVADLVLILTNHSDINYESLANRAKLIFDTRNVLNSHKDKPNIHRL